jgi:hypothetical protein
LSSVIYVLSFYGRILLRLVLLHNLLLICLKFYLIIFLIEIAFYYVRLQIVELILFFKMIVVISSSTIFDSSLGFDIRSWTSSSTWWSIWPWSLDWSLVHQNVLCYQNILLILSSRRLNICTCHSFFLIIQIICIYF